MHRPALRANTPTHCLPARSKFIPDDYLGNFPLAYLIEGSQCLIYITVICWWKQSEELTERFWAFLTGTILLGRTTVRTVVRSKSGFRAFKDGTIFVREFCIWWFVLWELNSRFRSMKRCTTSFCFAGEEAGSEGTESPRRWNTDTADGTSAFLRETSR